MLAGPTGNDLVDLGFVLETLEAEDATLVGWSMGCTISLEYLSRGGGRLAADLGRARFGRLPAGDGGRAHAARDQHRDRPMA